MNRKAWTASQLAKAQRAAEPDLFNSPLNELQPPEARLRFHYRCATPGCNGHRQELIDWELGAAAMHWRRQYGAQMEAKILEKWSKICDPANDVHFFVGNQHQHRRSFSVLGIWYPKKPT